MSGEALTGVPRINGKAPAKKFVQGGCYRSTDGTMIASIGAIRRGKYSQRLLASIDGEWMWCDIGRTSGCEIVCAETRRGVFVFQSARPRCER